MNRQTNDSEGMKGFLDRHLFTLIVGAAMIYSNFSSANSSTSTEVTEIKRRVGVIEDDVRYLRNRAIEGDSK